MLWTFCCFHELRRIFPQASVRTVVLKPPEKGCLPGRARRATRIEPHTSTYSRDTEANVLNELFEGAVWHQVTVCSVAPPGSLPFYLAWLDSWQLYFLRFHSACTLPAAQTLRLYDVTLFW